MRKNLVGAIDPWTPDGPAYLEDFSRENILQRRFSCKFFKYVSKYILDAVRSSGILKAKQ